MRQTVDAAIATTEPSSAPGVERAAAIISEQDRAMPIPPEVARALDDPSVTVHLDTRAGQWIIERWLGNEASVVRIVQAHSPPVGPKAPSACG